MRPIQILFTDRYTEDYKRLPQHLQKQTDRKLRLFATNPHHPSLRTKKCEGKVLGFSDAYEGSITMNYRFIFRIVGSTYEMLGVGIHTQIFGR